MNNGVRAILEQSFAAASEGIVVEEGLVRYNWPGHTRQVSQLPYCHEARFSAGYYAYGTLLGRLEEQAGLEMLEAIARLQFTDPEHPDYGGFLWYREESGIQDSNAAFFILMPLITVRLSKPEVFPASHLEVMQRMFGHAAAWFSRECRTPELFYPNKTMSDGAMLLAIAHFLEEPEHLQTACGYFARWAEYTGRRGWGWGENISLVYQGVMMNALRIAGSVLQQHDRELAGRLSEHMDTLKSILVFHDGEELVPTIRSYNFRGETQRPSLLWAIAGVAEFSRLAEQKFSLNDVAALLLFEEELLQGGAPLAALPVPRMLEERIFDASCSYSWIGRHTRLGSINRFPVMPGSYQHPTWGLGWQSFPVSFSVKDQQVSYLRWYVDDSTAVRTHPAEDYRTAYLMPALFAKPLYPEVKTRSAQQANALVVVRSMTRLHNRAAEIADEWVIHRYDGEVERVVNAAGDREWLVLRYPGCAVAVTALSGICAGAEARAAQPVTVVREEGRIRLRQVLYSGDSTLLAQSRLETGWAVVCLDEAAEAGDVRRLLDAVRIEDIETDDREVPREPWAQIRSIKLTAGHQPPVQLTVDPYAP
ncbi:hypothetical protein NST04_08260 [Paenibacillus sp. FSL H7-0756]|uniref:hypothetical protein n=1 Tax=unclassified Paenibacillus TaxID=185978 RepID=UPI0030F81636